jgi:pimeloyl-ACP methyl ester carboxylesterase
MPEVTTGPAVIHYEVIGAGPPLVFLHGRGGNLSVWWQQVAALADRYRCILIDLRGWGRSRGPLPALWPEAFVDDLVTVLAAVAVDKCAIVAQSMGGWALASFAERYPGRIVAAVMAASTGGLVPVACAEAYEAAWARQAAMRRAWATGTGPHPALGARLYAEQPELAVLYQLISSMNQPLAGAADVDILRLRRERLMLPVSTLFIAGDEDVIFPPPVMRAVAEAGGHPLHLIARAGHSAYFERAAAFNAAVAAFLDHHYPDPSGR